MNSDEWREGYQAGWEFHMGSGIRADNPYPFLSQEYRDWDRGFITAGEDS